MNVKLKVLMIKKGIKNFDLAKHLDFDPGKMSKIVNGWLEPDQQTKKRIAEYLGVEEAKLWGGTDNAS